MFGSIGVEVVNEWPRTEKYKEQRHVRYHNKGLWVERSVAYIATDGDGSVFSFVNKPYYNRDTREWYDISGTCRLIGYRYDLYSPESLVKVKNVLDRY